MTQPQGRKRKPKISLAARQAEKRGGDRGLTCPRCGCHHFEVIYTRPAVNGRIRRRRKCRHCGYKLTTIEQLLRDAKPERN